MSQRARILRVLQRILLGAQLDVHLQVLVRRGHQAEEQVVPHHQIHDFAGCRRAIVHVPDVGDRRQALAADGAQELQHFGQRLQSGGIGLDHGIGAIAEGLRRRERCLLAGDVVIETSLRLADHLPAVGHDPREHWSPTPRSSGNSPSGRAVSSRLRASAASTVMPPTLFQEASRSAGTSICLIPASRRAGAVSAGPSQKSAGKAANSRNITVRSP